MKILETFVWALGGAGLLWVSGIDSFWIVVLFLYGVLFGMNLTRKDKPSRKAKEKTLNT
jgi:hypothetical protein